MVANAMIWKSGRRIYPRQQETIPLIGGLKIYVYHFFTSFYTAFYYICHQSVIPSLS